MKKSLLSTKNIVIIVFVLAIITQLTKFYDNRPPLHRKYHVEKFEIPVHLSHFVVYDTNIISRNLSELGGEVTILAMWAPWCKYCKTELPDMAAQLEKLKQNNIGVIAVASPRESLKEIKNFFLDPALAGVTPYISNSEAIFQKLGVRGYPSFYILDKNKRALAKFRPAWYENDIFELLNSFKES